MRDFADRLYLDPPLFVAYTLGHKTGQLFQPDDRHEAGVMRGSLAHPKVRSGGNRPRRPAVRRS